MSLAPIERVCDSPALLTHHHSRQHAPLSGGRPTGNEIIGSSHSLFVPQVLCDVHDRLLRGTKTILLKTGKLDPKRLKGSFENALDWTLEEVGLVGLSTLATQILGR